MRGRFVLFHLLCLAGASFLGAHCIAQARVDNAKPAGPAGVTIWKSDKSLDAIQPCTDDTGKVFKIRSAPSFTGGYSGTPLQININMAEKPCIPEQVNLAVSNRQKITVAVTYATDDSTTASDKKTTCSATESATPVAPIDIGAIIAKFLAKAPTVVALFEGVPIPTAVGKFPLPPIPNTKATIAISCSIGTTPMPPKTIVVTYQNVAPVSASAGVIVSTLGSKTYAVSTTYTPAAGPSPAAYVYTIKSASSTVQLVPVAFLNIYGFGNRNTHLDLQAGLGINPNGSKTKVEYFFGPALAWHGLHLSPGLHIAQADYLSNGFTVGETVPTQNFAIPNGYHTTLKLGFSITYSPKLPSSSSPAAAGPGI